MNFELHLTDCWPEVDILYTQQVLRQALQTQVLSVSLSLSLPLQVSAKMVSNFQVTDLCSLTKSHSLLLELLNSLSLSLSLSGAAAQSWPEPPHS